MFDFLFKKKKDDKREIHIPFIYKRLKEIYNAEDISEERKKYLSEILDKYGYLPYPQIKVLEELSPAETIFCLDYKLKKEGVYDGEKFLNVQTSPVKRQGINSPDWIKKEGHDIKLINLAALGNGNREKTPANFIDWLKQLIILPVGVKERNILATTIYLIPFHPRNFGCAYLPLSNDVSPNLEDKKIKTELGIDAKLQVQSFITLAQLAGHPVIYDILPQTDRFSKEVLANPSLVRWLDVKEIDRKLENCLELVAKELCRKYDQEDVEIVKDIYKQDGNGELSEHYQKIYDEYEEELLKLKKTNSSEMQKQDCQVKIQKRVKEIVKATLKTEKKELVETDITQREEIIKALMEDGLWTIPGGAWCSAGIPVYDKMSDCKTYPIFKHFNYKDEDVTELANMDCQSPYYFTFLENGSINMPVVNEFIKKLKKLYYDYNFDGFRFSQVDHIIDELSQKKGKPISCRIPANVLSAINMALKEDVPYFACIAEYMLGGDNLKEYHKDMKFDLLWGNDIPAQCEKTPEKIIEDNQHLTTYNTKDFKSRQLSIIKTYNNQDGEFSEIDEYPAKLGRNGALFKWFAYKFLPGGKHAQRPVMYVDGDESFTQTGIGKTIGYEISMKRERDSEFFSQFDAINRFAKSQEIITEGEAQILTQDEDGFAAWIISKEPLKQAFLIVANYKPQIQKFMLSDEIGKHLEIIENEPLQNKRIYLPGDYKITAEYYYVKPDFIKRNTDKNSNWIEFETLVPSEFKIYLLQK